MSRVHFVRVGCFGQVGRFTAVDAVAYPRGARVILRTPRGLEVGEILGPADDSLSRGTGDGAILRGMTVADELLDARLQRRKHEALATCEQLLRNEGSTAVLMDAEPLFDGNALYFYFLGELPQETATLTRQLAESYAATTEFHRFAETLATGCGPDCGTESAAGGGCSSCSTGCAVAGSCAVKTRTARVE